MSENNVKNIMDATMENLKGMINADVITGDPIVVGEITLIPVSKVAFGFGAGGSDIPVKGGTGAAETPFGGGSGAGVSIKPVGFLVVGADQIKLLPVGSGNSSPVDKLFEFIPQMVDKVNSIIKEKKEKKETSAEL